MAKVEAFKIRWVKRSAKLLLVGDHVSVDVIHQLIIELHQAIEHHQNLQRLAARWRCTQMEPWLAMGRDLARMLDKD